MMEGLFGVEAVAGAGTSQKVLRRVLSSADDHNVFSLRSVRELDEDDEEALRWAALEKLPTYDRVRRGILENVEHDSGNVTRKVVDVAHLNFAQRQRLLEKILHDTEDDNEKFLLRLRERIDKVGIELPTIEVRYQDLTVEAEVHIGSNSLPTLFNFTVNLLEGLLVCFRHSLRRKMQLTILKGISGIIRPSRMTLLLGPPNSGKTTLLLALAGKLSSDLKVSGDITYNGHALTAFIPQRTSAYISQQDIQLGEMTVRETLDFSARCQGVGTRNDILTELLRREKEHGIQPDPDLDVFMKAISLEGQETNLVTDYVIKILGLDICADTLVGDQMRRGISGGQKKRVTTGEMLVGPAKVFFMDEISTGLDSSTTFQIVNCLRHIVHIMDETLVVSLLQPAPETFELFDDIILLSDGVVVYDGPREFVLDFFEDVGFKCPERKSVADFLQEVTSVKDQAQYWIDRGVPYRYVSAREFSDRFAYFHVGRRMQEELSTPFDKSKSHPAALSTKKYGLNKWDLFKACFWREWLLMRRNSFVYIFKTCQISVVSIIGMTVFFRTTLHSDSILDGNLYLGALFFGLTNVMFNGFADLGMVISRLPVFYKQRGQLFYPAWAYAIPAIIMRIPVSILESTIWVCLTYYVIGFSPEPIRFFLQLLLLFSVSIMALGLFRCLGAIGRSPIMATTFGSFSLMVVFVLGGFVISKDNVPKWWIWANWSSPMMYGQNAIAINEFLGHRWQKPNNDTSIDAPTIGEAVLKSRGMFTEGYWYWISLGALIGFAVIFNCIFTFALAYLKPLGKPQAVIHEKELIERSNGAVKDDPNVGSNGTKKARKLTSGPFLKSTNYECFDQKPDDFVTDPVTLNGGMILPFQPLSISFNNINYYVDMPHEMKQQGVNEDRLQLLRNVSGAFRPGILTALMGVSGAGKTTLMDVLAGRKTGGYIKGDITISGFPKKQETFARISGYCEQNDIHSPNVTVRESLIYSAWLRLSNDVNKETRMMFVKEVMELVELDPLKDALVGLPGIYGLSTEQRKRLTIAVELVANPSIIFMDEPTSGLDARAAAIVMRTVRNTVNTGRTVVCTIHQPSINIFESFDELLLLKRGGEVIYSGPLGHHSQGLIRYFEAIPGIPKIKDGSNPAAWMLEITSPARESRLGVDFAYIYRESSIYQNCQDLIKEISVPQVGSKELCFSTKYAQGFLVQCQACLWKRHWSYWRNPHYNVVRLLFTTAVAVIFGTVFWKMGSKMGTVQDVNNLMGALYAMIFFLGVSNSNTVGPVVAIERTVHYREKAAGMYSCLAYAFSQIAIEIPYVMVQTIIYALIIFSMLGLPWQAAKFFYFTFFMFFTFLYFTCYGMMAVALTPSLHFATIISSSVNSLWNLFSGFMIPLTKIPVWWRWYYWVDPISWTLYGLIESQLGDLNDKQLDVPGRGKEAVSQYLDQYFGYHADFLGVVVVMHLVFPFLFICVYGFCIRNFNFQRR